MKDFKSLQVWEKSHLFTVDIYHLTEQFPKSETFGLVSQLRRAAASVPAYIAEGCGRNTDADFCRFLHIASGSASEVEYHLILSRDLNYISAEKHKILDKQVNEIKKMLNAFQRTLSAKS